MGTLYSEADDETSRLSSPLHSKDSWVLTDDPVRKRHFHFPLYGTEEFRQKCPWASLPHPSNYRNCTVYASQSRNSTQGIAEWVSVVSSAVMLARQASCHLKADYADNSVDLSPVLTSCFTGAHEWMLPPAAGELSCNLEDGCFRPAPTINETRLQRFSAQLGLETTLSPVPQYRFGYWNSEKLSMYDKTLEETLQWALPGWDAPLGMACALNGIFCLSPKADQFEPDLFTRILPKLQDDQTLVLSVYFRTGWSKKVVRDEDLHARVFSTLRCAMKLEQEYLMGTLAGINSKGSISRVVWLVVSDSPQLREHVIQKYGKNSSVSVPPSSSLVSQGAVLPRDIVTTQSKGRHSRPKGEPSVQDVAQAFLDWYLIGESDVVVSNRIVSTFGATAALRTARWLYDGSTCQRQHVFSTNGKK